MRQYDLINQIKRCPFFHGMLRLLKFGFLLPRIGTFLVSEYVQLHKALGQGYCITNAVKSTDRLESSQGKSNLFKAQELSVAFNASGFTVFL